MRTSDLTIIICNLMIWKNLHSRLPYTSCLYLCIKSLVYLKYVYTVLQ
jgi:hypothetical protein